MGLAALFNLDGKDIAAFVVAGLLGYLSASFGPAVSGVNYSFPLTTTKIPDSCWNVFLSSPVVVAGRAGAEPRRGGAEGLPATTGAGLVPPQLASLLSGAGSRVFLASSIR